MTIEELVKETEKRPNESKEQTAERTRQAKAEAQRRGYCFAEGTVVQTAAGPKPLETVVAGEMIQAKAEGEDIVRSYAVAGVMRGVASTLYRVEVDGRQMLSATGGHPFFVLDKGWTRARDIAAGNRLASLSGESVVVTNVFRERLTATVATFNLLVDEAHTYFVGQEPAVLVHNGTPVGEPVLNGPLIWGLSSGGPRLRMPRPADPTNVDPKLREPIEGDLDGASGWRSNSQDELGRMLGTRATESVGNNGAITEAQLKAEGLIAVESPGRGALAEGGFTHVSIRPESKPGLEPLTEAEMLEVKTKLERIKPVAQNKPGDFLCV